MRLQNIGQFKTADEYVADKVKRFAESDHSFTALFSFMFSERENILYEQSNGYSIRKVTYGEAYTQTLRLAKSLQGVLREVPAQSIVAIAMQNSVEWIETFWAVLLCGYRPLLVNLRLDSSSLNEVLQSAKVQVVISDSLHYPIQTILFSEIPASEEELIPAVCGEEFFVMSSGTSFHVKLCAYSSEELYYQICDSAKIIKQSKKSKEHYQGELKLLTFLPFYHIFGFVAVYIWFAFFSRTFVDLRDFSPQTILNTIRRHKVTHIFAVPMFWEKVYSEAMRTIQSMGEKTYRKLNKGLKLYYALPTQAVRNAFSRVAFKEVREKLFGESICFCISGGSTISKEVFAFFNAVGYHLTNGYGMTEVGITSVELSANAKVRNTLSVGVPFSSVEYQVSPQGELLVRGKSVAKYVLCHGNKTTLQGDWFNTHDLAEFKNGRYYIAGRMDDVVVGRSGENLNPNLVEPLLACDGAREVCLIASRKKGNVVPVLVVSVSKYISAQKLADLKARLTKVLTAQQLDKQIAELAFVSTPLLSENDFKLNRTKVARLYDNDELTFVTPYTESEEEDCNPALKQRIKEYFAVALQVAVEEISYTADFFLDYGGNSLDYFAMLAQIQDEFHVSFPNNGNAAMNTVKSICDYLKEKE